MPSALVGSIDTTASVSSQFTLLDAASNNPVSGASVYASCQQDGSTVTATSDGSGLVSLSLHPGDYDLTCTATNYQAISQVFHVLASMSTLPDTIQMTASAPATVDVQLTGGITGDPSTPATMYTVWDSKDPNTAKVVGSGSFDQNTGTATVTQLTKGNTYYVDRTTNGYITESVAENNPSNFVADSTASLTPMQKSGETQQTLDPTDPRAASQQQPPPSPVSSPVPAVPSYEWQYPNSSFGKYLTTTQARMYIGNVFIDEFHDVQFALQSNKVPVYGYCSRDPDAFGKGRALVQGQLSINFISEGYLYTVLRDAAGQNPPKVDNNVQSAVALVQQKADPSLTPAQLTSVNTQLANLAATIGPDKMDQVRQAVSASTLTSSGIKPNAVYQDIPFTLQLQMTGAGRTVIRTLKNCLLVSNEQVYDQSGEPLRDVYGFIAQSLL
jgi:hypothetical protein